MWKKNCPNEVISDALTFSAERNVSCTLGVTLLKTDAVMTFLLTRLKHFLLKCSINNNNNNNNNNNDNNNNNNKPKNQVPSTYTGIIQL